MRQGSAKGKVLYAQVLAAGSHIRLVGRKLWVDVGAPWNLSVKVERPPRARCRRRSTGHLLVTRSGVRTVA